LPASWLLGLLDVPPPSAWLYDFSSILAVNRVKY
jgi:hypothetical protein